jgi:hypothetical protein
MMVRSVSPLCLSRAGKSEIVPPFFELLAVRSMPWFHLSQLAGFSSFTKKKGSLSKLNVKDLLYFASTQEF